ncbi:MAG: hypothetical protein PHW72_03240 [Candidatus Pacebacteria bacterium]|nr:hypothetical protein [Candidatus Paceibacterota bacterium]
MPKLKGSIRALIFVGLTIVAIFIIGIPLFVSTQILPSIRRETVAEFPEGNLKAIKDFVDENSEPWEMSKGQKYMGFEEPTKDEIAAIREGTDLTRYYPTSLKAIFDPGAVSNTVDLLYYSDELADLGVNTYWVIGEYRMNDYKISQFSPSFDHMGFPKLLNDEEADRVLSWRILLAKRLGFATIIIPDYPSLFNIGRQNFDLNKVEPEFVRVALDLAKIAEDNGAEYFAPVNEYNHLLISNGYSMDEIVENEKRFYGDLLPEIRKIFHGKIVIKNGAVNNWNNFKRESMTGADLFGVGNAFTGIRTRENMSPKVAAANFVSARDGVPWFESEFVVYRPIDQEHWMGYVQSTAPMENTYREGLDIFEREAKGAVGFTFMSWTGVGKIRGTTAVEAMEDFFTEWQPTPKLTPDQNTVQPFLAGGQNSLINWFKNLPAYYSLAFNIFTGKMGPGKKPQVQDPIMGEGGLPCKGKEECDAYCAKPENRAECEKAKGGGESNSGPGGQDQRHEGDSGEKQGGPGGCKSDAECTAYCDKPENKAECMKFQPQQ